MSFTPFKEITVNNPGTTIRYGGNDLKELFQILNGTLVPDRRPKVANEWHFLSSAMKLRNPADTFSYTLQASAITANRTITIPLLSGNVNMVVDAFANTFTEKQTIQMGHNEQLDLYRPSSTLNTTVDISFYHNNLAAAKRRLSAVTSELTDNTTSLEDTAINLWVQKDGLFMRALRIDSLGNLVVSGNVSTSQSFVLATTGLTALRTFTFPNASTALAGLTVANTFTEIQTVTRTAAVGKEQLATWRVSDDLGSTLIIWNNSAVDGQFTPLVESTLSVNAPSTLMSLGLQAQIQAAADTGTSLVSALNLRRVAGGQITSRSLFAFQNNGFDVLKINAFGDIVQNIVAQAGAEMIHEWKVSDDTTSFLRLENATTGAAVFESLLRAEYNSSNGPSMYQVFQCSPINDTGVNALLFMDFRRNDGAAITTRPFMRMRNAGALVFEVSATQFNFNNLDLINVDKIVNSPGTTIIVERPSAAGSAEALMQWQVSDDTLSRVELVNGNSTDGLFVPWFRFQQRGNASHPALYSYGYIEAAHDTGTAPIFIFSSRRVGDTNITTRPLMDWRNAATQVFRINANGDLLVTPLAQAGVAETLQEWRPNDVNSYVRFINASPTDARFLPMLRGRQVEDATLAGLSVEARCEAAHDTGTAVMCSFDARTHSDTAITTRPLFDFRTAGIVILRITPTIIEVADAKNIQLGGTTGTKIGTATTQKIGFFNAIPVVQRPANPDTTGASLASLEQEVNELKQTLRELGLIA